MRKKRHMEVDATTAEGRVRVFFDLTGRVWEIEDESHGNILMSAVYLAVSQAVARAGFAEPAAGEVKKNHTVVRARTQKGEAVDLHVD